MGGSVVGSDLGITADSCCYPNFVNGYAFDRVIYAGAGNLGVGTEMLLNPLPSWAHSARLHRPIRVVFAARPSLQVEVLAQVPPQEPGASVAAEPAAARPSIFGPGPATTRTTATRITRRCCSSPARRPRTRTSARSCERAGRQDGFLEQDARLGRPVCVCVC